jgi:hypothetical protein
MFSLVPFVVSSLPAIIAAILTPVILAGILFLTRRSLLDAVFVVSLVGLAVAAFYSGSFVLEVVADGFYLGVSPELYGLEVARRLVSPALATLIFGAWLLAQVDATQRRRWIWFAGVILAIVVYTVQAIVDDGLFASATTLGASRADPLVVALAIAFSAAPALFFVVPLLYSLLTRARMPPPLTPYVPAPLPPIMPPFMPPMPQTLMPPPASPPA